MIYRKLFSIIALMLFVVSGAWAQTNPTITTTTNNEWTLEMPAGNVKLRVTYYEQPNLAWKIGNEDVPATGVTIYLGLPFTAPTLMNEHNLNVNYQSTNTDVATIDTEGNITILTSGTTIIKAIFDGDDTYEEGMASYQLTALAATVLTLNSNNSERGSVKVEYTDSEDQSMTEGPAASLEVTPKGGSASTITAIPADGFHFVQWNDGNTDNPRTVVLTQNTTFTASFDTNAYALNVVVANGQDTWGNVAGSNAAAKHFRNYEISATPNTGYHFVEWNDGNTDNPRTVTLTQAMTFTASFDTNTYALNVVVADGQSATGSVAGSNAAAKHFRNYEISATAETGFYFLQWNDGNTDIPRTVSLVSDSTFTASFDTNAYALNVEVANGQDTWGSVAGSNAAAKQFRSYEISATPNTGYHFVEWNDGNTENPRMVSHTQNTTYTARFDTNTYALNVVVADGQSTIGSVAGSNSAAKHFKNYEISATAETGFYFVQWNDGNTDNPRTVTLTQAMTFTASFDTNSYALNVVVADGQNNRGTVAGSNPTAKCFRNYEISATPETGYHFVEWNDGNTDNPRTVTLTQAMTYTASFDTNTYALNVVVADGQSEIGTVAGSNPAAKHFLNYEISATPETGYLFVEWNDGNTDNPRTVTLTQAMTFTARFDTNAYALNVEVANGQDTWGSVAGSNPTAKQFRSYEISATPNTGYHFVEWNDGNTDNPRTVTLTQAMTYTAIFDTNTYALNVVVADGQSAIGSVTGSNSAAKHFRNYEISATAETGFYFVQWNDGNTDNPRTVSLVSDSTFTASFDTNSYALNVVVANGQETWGSVAGSNPTAKCFRTYEISATPNTGYHFVEWNDGNTENPRMVSHTQNTTYTARFDTNTYALYVVVADGQSTIGSVAGSNSAAKHFKNYEISATAETGFHFVQWNDGNTDNPRTVSLVSDSTFTASFDTNTYALNVVVADGQSGRGTVAGSNPTAKCFRNYEISATPETGYHFVEWNDGNTDNPRTVSLVSDSTFTASFDTTKAELAWSSNAFTGYTMIDFNNYKPTLNNPHNVDVRYGLVENINFVKVNPETGFITNNYNVPRLTPQGTYHIYAVHETDQTYFYDSVVYTLNVNWGAMVSILKNIVAGGSTAFLNAEDDLTHAYSNSNNTMMAFLAPGASFTATATANEGYHFSKWQTGGNNAGYTDFATTAEATYTAPTQITSLYYTALKAVFDTNTYALNVEVANGQDDRGTVAGSNSAAKHFLEYEISATPETGYHFVEWNDGNTDNPRTVSLVSDSAFTASFAPDTFTVTYMNGTAQLKVEKVPYRESIPEYTPSKQGWTFDGWTPTLPELMPAENLTVYAQWTCDTLEDYDGNKYPSVQIGSKCWMAANLRATHYADGRPIANVYEYQSTAYPNVEENVNVAGRLYDWYTTIDTATLTEAAHVQGICPDGWYLPTAEDVAVLSAIPATDLRTTTGWIAVNGNTNSTGFSAYPAGIFNSSLVRYEGMGTETSWWSTMDPDPSTAITPSVVITAKAFCTAYHCDIIFTKSYLPTDGLSVRCVSAEE